LPFDSDLESKPALLAAQFLFALTMVVFSLLVAMRWKPTGLRDALGLLGFRRAGPRQFGLALLVLLAYYAVALLFAALVLMPEQEDIARQLGLRDGNTAVAVTAVLMIVVSLWPAAILSGIAFGIPHVTSGPTAAIPLSIFGVALAWIYERTRSIWPCILVHVVNNGIAIMAA
jgi:membrane protease YdiL (CAAX protease family)